VTIYSFIISLLTAVTFGQSLLCALILAPRLRLKSVYLPLALFFIANALTELSSLAILPIFFSVSPLYSGIVGFAAIPLYCVLAPLFWIYVRGLTSEHSSIWKTNDPWHFTLAVITLSLPAIAWLIPPGEFIALFSPSDDKQRSLVQTILVASTKALDILIILQIAFYSVLIVKRLATYRKKLTQLFASTEHLELRWFRWLALFLFSYVVLSVISIAAETLFRSPHSLDIWEKLVDVGLIITLAIWAQAQCKALALKIERAMLDDKLYQKDDLSLRLLAKHISELPNYVTQTLNTEIGESFFDYVNRWRIKDATFRLANSKETVLDIATDVGFNSRSSFYNAFKKIKGTTPSAYRKSQV